MSRCRLAWLAVVALVLAAGCGRKPGQDPIFVGHLDPLSGPDKAASEHARQAIQLALRELNLPENRLSGRPLTVLHVDTKGDADTAQREAVRLVRVNNSVGLLGGSEPGTAERLARAAQPYGIPVLTLSAFAPPPAAENVFVLGVPPGERGQVLARYAAQDLKVNRVAVVSDSRSPYHAAAAAGFVKDFPKDAKGRLDELTYRGEGEWPALAENLKKAGPEAVVVAADRAEFQRLRKQLLAAGLKPVWLFAGAGEDGADLTLGSDEGGAVCYATAFAGELSKEVGDDFAKKYIAEFKQPPDVHAVLAYDGVRLLFDALRRAKLASLARVREELAKTENFKGVTGDLTVAKDRTVRRVLYVVRVENGKAAVARSYTPGGK